MYIRNTHDIIQVEQKAMHAVKNDTQVCYCKAFKNCKQKSPTLKCSRHLNPDFFLQANHFSVISIVMEYAECGDLSERIKKQKDVEKTLFPEVIFQEDLNNGHNS